MTSNNFKFIIFIYWNERGKADIQIRMYTKYRYKKI